MHVHVHVHVLTTEIISESRSTVFVLKVCGLYMNLYTCDTKYNIFYHHESKFSLAKQKSFLEDIFQTLICESMIVI